MASTDVVTVSYTQPSDSPLRGLDGVVASFPARSVTNSVGDVPGVSGVAISSTPAHGDTYGLGETIRVKVTFDEAVTVDTAGGTPRLKIKMDPTWGEFWAAYESGSGTAELTFAHRVAEPNTSPRGVAVLGNTLERNGGTIRSAGDAGDRRGPGPPGAGPRPGPQGGLAAGGTRGPVGDRRCRSARTPAHGDTYGLGETIEREGDLQTRRWTWTRLTARRGSGSRWTRTCGG